MPIAHAIKFLREIDNLPELRDALYCCEGRDTLFQTLQTAGFPFTGGEFEEAVDHVHVSCQTYAEADQLMNKVNWFRIVSANA